MGLHQTYTDFSESCNKWTVPVREGFEAYSFSTGCRYFLSQGQKIAGNLFESYATVSQTVALVSAFAELKRRREDSNLRGLSPYALSKRAH